MLRWSSTNVSSCIALGGWSGSEPTSGSAATRALSTTTIYTLSCTGLGGTISQSVMVSVASSAAEGSSCSAANGRLTLQARAVRSAGVAPFLAFFDATETSDSAIAATRTAFQDVSYTWNFGDTGASGSGTWGHGANAGHDSKNVATGAVAAHLYVTEDGDTSYPVTVTAYDGTNTASCNLAVTAHAPSGANGFPGSATTCVAASGMPVAGSGGCPAGAAVLRQPNIGSVFAAAFGSNKRVLFKCGDIFTGSYSINATVQRASIGAYGPCVNTSMGRPIFQNSSGNTLVFDDNSTSSVPTDIRISDIDFEDGTESITAITNYVQSGGRLGNSQLVLYNLNCGGAAQCYFLNNATQSGFIQSQTTGCGGSGNQCVYLNYAENNCLNHSSALYCGNGGYSPAYYTPVAYNAIMGNSFNGNGMGGGGSGRETLRLSACRYCVISNNTVENANTIGAVLKLHSGNTDGSASPWLGQYVEYVEVSDNLFTGTSGGQLVEISPQNNVTDERLRYVVFERNLISATHASKVLLSGVNMTARSNVLYVHSGATAISDHQIMVAQRGIEPVAQAVEVYNNTCYALTRVADCVAFTSGDGTAAAGINSWAYNNLFYNNGASAAAVVSNGSGNTVSSNTTNSAANPGLIKGTGSLSTIADFQPTESYSGGTEVPVWYDALGTPWAPTWSLGAIKPATGANATRSQGSR